MRLIAFRPLEGRSGDEPVGNDGGHLARLRGVDAGCAAVLESASYILALFCQVSVQSPEKRQRQCPQETGKTYWQILTFFTLCIMVFVQKQNKGVIMINFWSKVIRCDENWMDADLDDVIGKVKMGKMELSIDYVKSTFSLR